MTLQETLSAGGLTTALILDDAYDLTPRAEDLADDEDAWANFIDDIGSYRDSVVAAFPDFDSLSADELRSSDAFVTAIWGLRSELPPELWETLFNQYEMGVQSDREFLGRLEEELTRLGLTVTTTGRSVPREAKAAAIIFADLYLGAAQHDPAMTQSISTVRDLIAGREADPPLVILMSRSGLVQDKKGDFRDRAGLLGTMFRVYEKAELLKGSNLPRTLGRLAAHREDAVRVARFVLAWQQGLKAATDEFMTVVRRLDLPDFAQIRNLLLAFEGQPLGSYMLDVLDRVLQHAIEADAATIEAAEDLNAINPDSYPTPHIAGSPDLQDLVYRTIWQHPRRLAVRNVETGTAVSFGDVLVHKNALANDKTTAAAPAEVLVVLTGSCDLVRGGAKRVMLMAGELAALTPAAWTYDDRRNLRTPIIILGDGRRMWISWNRLDVQNLLPEEMLKLIDKDGPYVLYHRFRESHAIELQQGLFAHMGRVGLIAPMPGTFPVTVECFTCDPAGTLQRLQTPMLQREGGVCFAGRDDDHRLVVTEEAVDELEQAIATLSEATTLKSAERTLAWLQHSSFAQDLLRALPVPQPTKKAWQPIKSKVQEDDGTVKERIVGMIARNPEADAQASQNAALVVVIRDVVPEKNDTPLESVGNTSAVDDHVH